MEASEYVIQTVIPKLEVAMEFLKNNDLDHGYGRYCRKRGDRYELCSMGALYLSGKINENDLTLEERLDNMQSLDLDKSFKGVWQDMGLRPVYIQNTSTYSHSSHIAVKITIWNDASHSNGIKYVIDKLKNLAETSPEVFYFVIEDAPI